MSQGRFGLYFDVGPREWSKLEYIDNKASALDIDSMQLTVGGLYRRLLFDNLYKSLEAKPIFDKLVKNGWFPFIEIMGGEYDDLYNSYKEEFNLDGNTEKIVNAFCETRLRRLWQKHSTFSDKQSFIDAALSNYLQDNHAGYISSIKIL